LPPKLYTPVPGTPLYQEMADQGRLLTDVDPADIHGQYISLLPDLDRVRSSGFSRPEVRV
jgi:hypothetical protein